MITRCPWARSELSIAYHDHEWGVPLHGDQKLFELLTLEGAQAGLSWETILNKRARYHVAFDGFAVATVARYSERKVAALLADPGIVRNRAKVASTIANARAILELQREFGSLDAYLWRFVDGAPILNSHRDMDEVPATSPLSDRLSKSLKIRGLRFVGSTICYAFMQASGMVNDHLTTCFRHAELLAPQNKRETLTL